MYQTDYPPWPDAKSALLADGARVSPEQLCRLGSGDPQAGVRQLRMMIAAETERKVSAGPIERPANVRFAIDSDEDAIVECLLRDAAENASQIAPPSRERIMALVQAGTRKQGGIIGIIDGDDGPAAVCVLTPAQWWWSDAWYLMDVVTYVSPEHRNGKLIDDLIDFERWLADQWTEQCGYRVFLITGVMGTRKLREKFLVWWQRLTEVGRAYCYPPPDRMSP